MATSSFPAQNDLSGNELYNWNFFAREYVADPLAINFTTGHTMLTFDNKDRLKFLDAKKPHSIDFVDGQIYMLGKFSEFFHAIYEKGRQPHPKYLLKTLEFLTHELEFKRAEAEENKS
jgi:hypothetical protein